MWLEASIPVFHFAAWSTSRSTGTLGLQSTRFRIHMRKNYVSQDCARVAQRRRVICRAPTVFFEEGSSRSTRVRPTVETGSAPAPLSPRCPNVMSPRVRGVDWPVSAGQKRDAQRHRGTCSAVVLRQNNRLHQNSLLSSSRKAKPPEPRSHRNRTSSRGSARSARARTGIGSVNDDGTRGPQGPRQTSSSNAPTRQPDALTGISILIHAPPSARRKPWRTGAGVLRLSRPLRTETRLARVSTTPLSRQLLGVRHFRIVHSNVLHLVKAE